MSTKKRAWILGESTSAVEIRLRHIVGAGTHFRGRLVASSLTSVSSIRLCQVGGYPNSPLNNVPGVHIPLCSRVDLSERIENRSTGRRANGSPSCDGSQREGDRCCEFKRVPSMGQSRNACRHYEQWWNRKEKRYSSLHVRCYGSG